MRVACTCCVDAREALKVDIFDPLHSRAFIVCLSVCLRVCLGVCLSVTCLWLNIDAALQQVTDDRTHSQTTVEPTEERSLMTEKL